MNELNLQKLYIAIDEAHINKSCTLCRVTSNILIAQKLL